MKRLRHTDIHQVQQEELTTHARPRLYLNFVKAAVHINGTEVIAAQATTRLRLIKALVKQRYQDYLEGRPPEAYTRLTITKMAEGLEAEGQTVDAVENLRRTLNTTKQIIPIRLYDKLGLIVSGDDIIECHGWPGFNRIDDYGYRLNPYTLLLKL